MQKNIYHIAPNSDFLRQVATYVLEQVGGDFLKLAEVRIFLPNKRSSLKLKEYFVQHSENKAVILPKIFSLSDISLEEFEFEPEFRREIETSLKPAIKKEERIFLLTRIIRQSAAGYNLGHLTFEAALKLSISLCGIIDEMHKYEVAPEKLGDLFPHELSEFRQISLNFLKFIIEIYKKELAAKNRLDLAARNILVTDIYSKILAEKPSQNLVVIAGSSGSHSAVKRLIKTIMELPSGRVFLPYIDMNVSEKEWAEIERENNEINHQKHLFTLLKFLGVKRAEIQLLGNAGETKNLLISEMMKCGSSIETWKNLEAPGLEWLRLIEADSQIREAKIICAIVREKLEAGKNVGVVTNDDDLTQKINLFLPRFGIRTTDYAGLTLDKTVEGKFLLQLAQVISSDFGIIDMLSFLKSPLVTTSKNIREIEGFERRVIRKNNLRSLKDVFAVESHLEKSSEQFRAKLGFLNDIYKAVAGKNEIEVGELLKFSLAIIESLCEVGLVESDNWQSIEEVLSFFANEGASEKIEKKLFAEILQITLSSRKAWPKQTFDEQVSILTPLEARLQYFDCTILAGVNLGSWPENYFSPWLSRSMNSQINMDIESDMIALSAHDLVAHLHGSEVFITLSKQRGGEPALESPLVSRIKIFAKLKDINIASGEYYESVVEFLDGVDTPHIAPEKPAPKPPFEARPNSISVTNVENIIKNPYAFYANKILGLKKIDELENEGTTADYGSFVHRVIENFARLHQLDIEKITRQNFTAAIASAAQELAAKNLVNPAWITQIEQTAKWFVDIEKRFAAVTSAIFSEEEGMLEISRNGKIFKLVCKADRLEISRSGEVNIIDFKTGGYPAQEKVKQLIGPQLVLEALMAKRNGFKNMKFGEKNTLGKVVYYNISFSKGGPERKEYEVRLNELEQLAEIELNNLIDDLLDPEAPFLVRPRTKIQPDYDDYEHLERVEN